MEGQRQNSIPPKYSLRGGGFMDCGQKDGRTTSKQYTPQIQFAGGGGGGGGGGGENRYEILKSE